jgi:hypothetical protein
MTLIRLTSSRKAELRYEGYLVVWLVDNTHLFVFCFALLCFEISNRTALVDLCAKLASYILGGIETIFLQFSHRPLSKQLYT